MYLKTLEGSYEISYTSEPNPIPFLEFFGMDIGIVDAAGNVIPEDVNLIIDADMPEHRHGMNHKPEVSKLGPGKFKVEGMRFHMLGYWEITIILKKGDQTETAVFSYYVD